MATDAHNAKVDRLLRMIREGKTMTLRQQLSLVVQLSIPAIVAQFSSIAMQYIDAAMVGSVGADASASIGLVSTSTWLMMGLCSAVAIGFTVQVFDRSGFYFHVADDGVVQRGCNRVYRAGGTFGRRE